MREVHLNLKVYIFFIGHDFAECTFLFLDFNSGLFIPFDQKPIKEGVVIVDKSGKIISVIDSRKSTNK